MNTYTNNVRALRDLVVVTPLEMTWYGQIIRIVYLFILVDNLNYRLPA